MKTLSMSEFEKLLTETSDVNLLDVRGREAFQIGHIAGAVNVPIDELQAIIKDLDETEDYYIVCYSGNSSAMVGEFLTRNGFKAINVQGGMNDFNGPTIS